MSETPSDNPPPLTPDDLGKVPLWRSGVLLLLAAVVGFAPVSLTFSGLSATPVAVAVPLA